MPAAPVAGLPAAPVEDEPVPAAPAEVAPAAPAEDEPVPAAPAEVEPVPAAPVDVEPVPAAPGWPVVMGMVLGSLVPPQPARRRIGASSASEPRRAIVV